MNIKRIKETCIYINDIDASKNFYNGILKLPIISEVKNRHIFFEAGESVLLCFIAETTKDEKQLPPHGGYGCIHFAFEVAKNDYDSCKLLLSNHAIEILQEQT